MDPSNLTWSKHSKPMHSMLLSMPMSYPESLAHLEHVMGSCWSLWADPHHPLSSKGFDLESKPMSNKVRSTTLKVAVTPYSPKRSILNALSLILFKNLKWVFTTRM